LSVGNKTGFKHKDRFGKIKIGGGGLTSECLKFAYRAPARLTFSYRFGNTELKNARRRNTGSENESSRVKVE